jgi:hypothetical protein
MPSSTSRRTVKPRVQVPLSTIITQPHGRCQGRSCGPLAATERVAKLIGQLARVLLTVLLILGQLHTSTNALPDGTTHAAGSHTSGLQTRS